jgi:formate hydrogenlyase subunit 4
MDYLKNLVNVLLMPIHLTLSGTIFNKHIIYLTIISVICVLLVAYIYNYCTGKFNFKDIVMPTFIIEIIALLYGTALIMTLVSAR